VIENVLHPQQRYRRGEGHDGKIAWLTRAMFAMLVMPALDPKARSEALGSA